VSPTDSTDELRKQIAAEREQLVAATSELRAEVDELKRKLPKVAAAVIAAGALVAIVRRVLR
jgi:outer membrane murein-binding lipoprotein Lpp